MSLETFITSYFETALWSSNDNTNDQGGLPLDDEKYYDTEWDNESGDKLIKDCTKFYEENNHLWDDDVQAGHDFWLTQNMHGAGFWDGDYPEHGNTLTETSHKFKEQNIYIGDDGKFYI